MLSASDPEPREAPSVFSTDVMNAPASRRRRWCALRGAVALARARLRSTRGGRVGAALAVAITLGGAIAIAFRIQDGTTSHEGLLGAVVRWLAWGAAAPIALTAAHDRASFDRRDGIEALAATRGFSRAAMHSARSLAAMLEIARAIALPALILSALAALLSGSAQLAFRHIAFGAALAIFALVAGATLGGLAAASGQVGGTRGRALFAALILVPWGLTDLAGGAAWSIPGALNAFLSFAARSMGGPGV
jgi:hypothetical protein